MRNIARPLSLILALMVSACGSESETNLDTTSNPAPKSQTQSTLPPLVDYLACLPQEAALIAAHRGTAKNTIYPENSMSALKALLDKGYLVAEIDVAGLKDGTHILYHDGVWDEKSTGKGPIASSTWKDAEKILLNDTKGKLSADRPVKFENYLKSAKGKIYLEVDFKSSAKYETVLDLIREHDMAEDVILISYNEAQSKKLARLAPDMMLSIGSNEALGQTRYKNNQVAAWVGYSVDNNGLIQSLRDKDIPVLGRIRKNWNAQAADAADLLVTDDVFDHKPIAGLTAENKEALQTCLQTL